MGVSARGLCAVGLGWILLAGVTVPAASADVEAITVTNADGRLEFHIEGTGESPDAVPVDAFVLTDPDRLIVDIPGLPEPVSPEVGEDLPEGLAGIRWATYSEEPDVPVSRYVLELTGPASVEVTREGSGTTVCAVPGDEAAPATAQEAAPEAEWRAPLDPEALETTAQRQMPSTLFPGGATATVKTPVVDEAPPVPDTPDWAQQWANDMRSMSLDVQGASIHAVLRSIAEFAGVNIVADRDVAGEVIIAIEELPRPKVLEAVCLSQGVRAMAGDGVIRVATLRTVQNEEIELESAARRREDLMPLATSVVPVSYAKAEELRESLNFLLSNRGSLNFDERTNTLLVTDIQPRIAALENMVQSLDTETVQVQIRARLIDADESAVREIGINWDLRNLKKDNVSGRVTTDLDDVLTPANEIRVGVIDNFGELDGVLQLLEDNNDAQIISNPTITTVSNREATILVGKEVPLIVLDEAGNPTTELKKVGIALRVTPVVNDNGRVTLDLHPEVSDLSSQATVQGGVVFTTTEADTRVMVDSGQTAVIGGLIRESTTKFERGIPVLMHIPVLGQLFKRTEDRKEMRELLIFVTPTILDGVAQLPGDRDEYVR